METIHVVLATDENYVQHTGVTILSLLETKKSCNPVVVYVIDDGLSSESRDILREIGSRYSASVEFLNVKSEALNDLAVAKHLSRVTYYRLDIANILPEGISKAVYLDVDVIVRDDITQLWQTDLSDHHLAAVVDYGILKLDVTGNHRASLGIPRSEPYFNAGVLLINLTRWKRDDIGKQVIQRLGKREHKFQDQDGLNAILRGKWLPLHPKWNAHKALFRAYYGLKVRKKLEPDVIQAVKCPSIVHFTGPYKPWHFGCGLPYSDDYWKLLRLTPWRNYRPPDINLGSLGKRLDWKLKRQIVELCSLCKDH